MDHNADPMHRGPDVLRRHLEGLRQTFPDFTVGIEDMVAEGDMVVTRVSGRGTHLGAWMGIEPRGTVVAVKRIDIDRAVAGRIAEHWGEADTIGMLSQMGVDPFAGRRS